MTIACRSSRKIQEGDTMSEGREQGREKDRTELGLTLTGVTRTLYKYPSQARLDYLNMLMLLDYP